MLVFGRESQKISELGRTKSNTFCWVEKIETYQNLVDKVETHRNLFDKVEAYGNLIETVETYRLLVEKVES